MVEVILFAKAGRAEPSALALEGFGSFRVCLRLACPDADEVSAVCRRELKAGRTSRQKPWPMPCIQRSGLFLSSIPSAHFNVLVQRCRNILTE